MDKNKKIFLIEDDLNIVEIYSEAFKAAGIDFEVIGLGREAIKKIKAVAEDGKDKPNIVLIDLILPDINGIEILKEIKNNENTKDIRVFILSNYSDADFLKAEKIKAEKFILKADIKPTQLAELIKKELKK